VIADWLLPDGEGLDLLRSEPVRAMPPIVIMTSHGSERVAVEAIRAGAVDYIVKSETALADLPHLAERAVRHRRVEQALGDLVAGTAASGGEALFAELVLRLARALRVKYASVAEIVAPGRVRTLARSGRRPPDAAHRVRPRRHALRRRARRQRLPHPRRRRGALPAGRGAAQDGRPELRRGGAARGERRAARAY
jgi:DNA-binding response OmpR family regulator